MKQNIGKFYILFFNLKSSAQKDLLIPKLRKKINGVKKLKLLNICEGFPKSLATNARVST